MKVWYIIKRFIKDLSLPFVAVAEVADEQSSAKVAIVPLTDCANLQVYKIFLNKDMLRTPCKNVSMN